MEIKTHHQKRYCVSCRSEQKHRFIYLGRYLKSGRCLSCGYEFNNRDTLFDIYVHDMMERILTKPLRMFRKFRRLSSADFPQSAERRKFIPKCIKLVGDEIQNVNQIWGEYDFDSNNTIAVRQAELLVYLTRFWGKKFKSVCKRITR